MADRGARRSRAARIARPLDRARLDELALAYAARFATTAARLTAYLARKLRERGWEGESEPDVASLVARLVSHRYVDDAAYGQAKTRDLLGRGYGARRVGQALYAAGVEESLRERFAPDEAERRAAAALLARKRRFGPFATGAPQTGEEAGKRREKQLAAMLRAGHDFAAARAVIGAASAQEVEEWVSEAQESQD